MIKLNTMIKNQRGFLLAELMLAIFVILVAIIALSGMLLQSFRANTFALNNTFATDIARQRMEIMKYDIEDTTSSNYAKYRNFGLYPYTSPAEPPISHRGQNFTVVVLADTQGDRTRGDADYKNQLVDVRVRVTWQEFGLSRMIELRTFCLRNTAFSTFRNLNL